MNLGAYAKRKAEAVDEIGRKTKIDLSPESMPMRANEPRILELFRLEKIAQELPEQRENEGQVYVEDAIKAIADIKGVGVTLVSKIEEVLKEL